MKNTLPKKTLALLAASLVSSAALFADDPPTQPGTPSATRTTFTKADILWAPSTDDIAVAGYKVYRDGIEIATTSQEFFNDTDLAAGTQYTYTVKAMDTADQLSVPSLPLVLSTLDQLDTDDGPVVEQIVEAVNPDGLSAAQLITTVQNAFAAIGYDPTFDKVDINLLTELVQQRIDEINEPPLEPETPESRAADKAELDAILLDHFAGNSVLSVYIHSNLSELAEKHFQNGKILSALTIYEHSLDYLPDVEPSVFGTLHRLSQIKLSTIDDDADMQDKIDILHAAAASLARFSNEFFPNSDSHLASTTLTRAAFNYFMHFPELLDYAFYNQDIYAAALAMINAAKAIDDSPLAAVRLERISAWEISDATVSIQDPSGTPITGSIVATNTSDTSRYPLDPVHDVRIFYATAAQTLAPMYLGHSYDLTVKANVAGGNPWVWNLNDVPHAKGFKYTCDHGSAPVATALPNPESPAQIVVISSQPSAPYNLAADKFIDTFTLSWNWVSPAGFTLKEFKVKRCGTEIATVTTQAKSGILLEIGNNTYTYTVTAYDINDNPSDESLPITVTPEFSPLQQAYFEWLQLHFGSTPVYDFEDADGDLISNYHEFILGSDPNLAPVEDVKATIQNVSAGLLAQYYPLTSAVTKLPDFSSMTPSHSEVLQSSAFSNNYGDILGSNLSDHVAVRLTGYLDVPADANYRFYLNSDDGSKLLIGGNTLINNDGRHSAREYSGDMRLRAGVHAVEIQYFDYTGSATLRAEWNGPGMTRSPIDASCAWHTPTVTPLLAESLAHNRDSDGDGLPDIFEYQLGTDPFKADTDGDLISDYDEVVIYGTNPLNPDTDGDGFLDYEEIFVIFPDPLVADLDNSVTDILVLNGSDCSISQGLWHYQGSTVAAASRNGSIEYILNIPVQGVYRIELDISENNPYSTSSRFTVALYADGHYIAKTSANAPYGTSAKAHFYLPSMSQGQHSFKFKWENVRSNTSLRVNSVTLQALGGPDLDNNGIPDWIDNRLEKLSQISIPAESRTSPVCAEGENQLNIGTLEISGFYTEPEEDPVHPDILPAPMNKWYADIALSPLSATVLSFDFQNSSRIVNKTVEWTETNVFLDDDTMIRLGDSLLLAAFPENAVSGTSVITVDGEEFTVAYDLANIRNSVPFKFENPGIYTVSATYTPDGGTPGQAQIEVNVVASSFASAPIAILNQPRPWLNPAIPDEAVIYADHHITLFESPLIPDGRTLDMLVTADRPGFVAARLASQNGPIIQSRQILVTEIDFLPTYRATVVETFPDGSVLTEFTIALTHVPEDIAIHLKIFVGGHLFEDGTIEKWAYASDFDEFGVFKYRILRAPTASTGVCHRVEISQNGTLLKNY